MWPYKGGLTAGSKGVDEKNITPDHKVCKNCGRIFSEKCNKVRHQKYYCLLVKGINPIDLEKRRKLCEAEDKQMEEVFESVTSNYAKFKICENPKNPMPLPGFWPILFDYRGRYGVSEVDGLVGHKNGYQILASILKDKHIFHGGGSIKFKKKAYIETEEGNVTDISEYRVPRTHIIAQKGIQMRLDQPKFNVVETKQDVTISFNENYLKLLPSPIISHTRPDVVNEDMENNKQVSELEEEELNIAELFESQSDICSQEECFSQEFSQVSLEEKYPSPAKKRLKISVDIENNEEGSQSEALDTRAYNILVEVYSVEIINGLGILFEKRSNTTYSLNYFQSIELLHLLCLRYFLFYSV